MELKMKIITVKDLKEIVKTMPEDTIVCCQSDSEGNSTSACMGIFVEMVGRKHIIEEHRHNFTYIGGSDIVGIDQEKDKGKHLVIFQPIL
jgi:hypothetical protein